jgi:hypothetical protein
VAIDAIVCLRSCSIFAMLAFMCRCLRQGDSPVPNGLSLTWQGSLSVPEAAAETKALLDESRELCARRGVVHPSEKAARESLPNIHRLLGSGCRTDDDEPKQVKVTSVRALKRQRLSRSLVRAHDAEQTYGISLPDMLMSGRLWDLTVSATSVMRVLKHPICATISKSVSNSREEVRFFWISIGVP